MKRVYYLRTPKKYVECYRVVASSRQEALETVATNGEQLSHENETDTGPTEVKETDEPLTEWDK